jgi:GMP synthase-like glutamine amidotransferase
MRAHVLQHVPFEGPGSIGPWLERHGATVTTTRFFELEPLPEASDVDFVVALGGPMSANDEARLPWLVAEKRFLRDVIGREVPVLGVCLGAQLIAGSLGARVYRNPQKEIGWFPITTEADALGLRDGLRVFHWHGETCRHQAFRIGRHVIGLQFHLETTPAGARALVEHCRAELVPGPYVQTERAILAEPAATYAAANRAMAALLDALVP